MSQDKLVKEYTNEELRKYKLTSWVAFAFIAAGYVICASHIIITHILNSGNSSAGEFLMTLVVVLLMLPSALVKGYSFSFATVSLYLFIMTLLAAYCLNIKTVIPPLGRLYMLILLTPFWLILILGLFNIFDVPEVLSTSVIIDKITMMLLLIGLTILNVAVLARLFHRRREV